MAIKTSPDTLISPAQVGQPKGHYRGRTTYYTIDDVNYGPTEWQERMRAARELESDFCQQQREGAYALYKLLKDNQSSLQMESAEDAQFIFSTLKRMIEHKTAGDRGSPRLFTVINTVISQSDLAPEVLEKIEFALSSCQRKGLFTAGPIPQLGRNGQPVKAGPTF